MKKKLLNSSIMFVATTPIVGLVSCSDSDAKKMEMNVSIMDSDLANFILFVNQFNESKTADNAKRINDLLHTNGLVSKDSNVKLSEDRKMLNVTKTVSNVKTNYFVKINYNAIKVATVHSGKSDFSLLVDTFNTNKNQTNANPINISLNGVDGLVKENSILMFNSNKTVLTIINTDDTSISKQDVTIKYIISISTQNATVNYNKSGFQSILDDFEVMANSDHANVINNALSVSGLVVPTSTISFADNMLVVSNVVDDVETTTSFSIAYHVIDRNKTANVNLSKDAFQTLVDTYNTTKNKANADAINTAISQPGLITATSTVNLSGDKASLTIENIVDGVTNTNIITLNYYSSAPVQTATVHSDKAAFKSLVTAFTGHRTQQNADAINNALDGATANLVTTNSVIQLEISGLKLTVSNNADNITTITNVNISYIVTHSTTGVVSVDAPDFERLVTAFNNDKSQDNANAINRVLRANEGSFSIFSYFTISFNPEKTQLIVNETVTGLTNSTIITLSYKLNVDKYSTVHLDKPTFNGLITTFNTTKNKVNADAINNALDGITNLVTTTSTITITTDGITLEVVNITGTTTVITNVAITYQATP